MTAFYETKLIQVIIHKVGNKTYDEDIKLSQRPLLIDSAIEDLLSKYFLSPFKSSEYFNFFHQSDIKLNEVFTYISAIFDNPDVLFEQSVNLAKHLYEQSIHPKVKGGEFYVAYFKDCIVDGEKVNAVGLFKSESKDTFLKVYPSSDGFNIESEVGININKLDKGCLIFNSEREKGYLVSVVDNLNKSSEAQYWIDNFLHVRSRKDEYFQTQNLMRLCKNFVTDRLVNDFDMNKAEQADLLNKSVKFFKEKNQFDLNNFTNEVIMQPEIIDSFKNFKSEFERDNDMQLPESFAISESAVKKQSRILKSVIKLDNDFHIYVHGNRQHIIRGFDKESGLHFYQIFFKEEK